MKNALIETSEKRTDQSLTKSLIIICFTRCSNKDFNTMLELKNVLSLLCKKRIKVMSLWPLLFHNMLL